MSDDLWDGQNKALGAFIRTQRELARLSLRQLSEMTDVSNAYLSQIERGLHEPSIRVIRSVANALGVAPEVLLARAGLIDADEDRGTEGREGSGGSEPAAGRSGRRSASAVSTEDAIRRDPKLTDAEKEALLSVYRSYTANRG